MASTDGVTLDTERADAESPVSLPTTEDLKFPFSPSDDPVEDENEQPQLKISGNPPQREGHKQEQGRQVDEELQ